MQLQSGARLGPYEIIAPLGEGGMGEVYRARDTRLDREVAIKIIGDQRSNDPAARRRFEQEARAVAAVSHPNIVAIHDVGDEQDMAYAVMELLRGESLADLIGRERLSWRKAVDIAAAVAEGLASAHAHGFIHRDLKPGNIFLTDAGQVKILDFGLAKQHRVVGSRTMADAQTESYGGLLVGTIGYMSPEQVAAAPVDARSDIFSLGCVLYEMVTGERAFRKSSPGATFAAILRDEPDDISASGRTVPPALASIIRRCLEKNPDHRFQSARDLSFALRELAGSGEVPWVPSQPSRRTALVVAAIVITAVALTALFIWMSQRSRAIAGSPPAVRSVAVLPLANVSGDPAQEYLADGITEELIADIASIGDVRVISRTSSMSYKGSKKRLSEIARELGVDAVIEGSVMRSGDRVKITAALVDAKADRQLWANSFDRDLKNVLTVQRDIARAVARGIQIELSPAARSRLDEERTVDPRSFDAFVRGRYALNKGSRDDLFTAADLLQKSIDADPTNSLAYAAFAETYAQIGYFNYLSPEDSFPKAKAAAHRALELDPDLAEAHATLGYIHLYYDWDFAGADREFRRAIKLNPSLASAHRYYGVFLAAMLRNEEAERAAAAARSLDPLSVGVATDSGFVMYYERDYGAAAKALQDAVRMNPKAPGPHFWLARVYQAQGQYDKAISEYLAGGTGITQWPPAYAGLGHLYGVGGRRAQALEVLQQINALAANGYVSPYCEALIRLGLGEREATFAALRRCLEHRTNWLVWLLKDPRWDPMRSDPQFQEIVRRVGFPADAQARAKGVA